MLREEPSLISDGIRLVSMLLLLLGAIGAVAGAIIGFSTPASPVWLPALTGGAISIVLGIILMILILEGFIGE